MQQATRILLPELENHFQPELDFSRGNCSLIDRPRTSGGSAVRIEQRTIVNRCVEDRVIENIKELRTELNVEILGDLLDIVVLEQREIEIERTWSDHAIAPDIGEQVLTGSGCRRKGRTLRLQGSRGACRKRWKSKAVELDIVVGITRIDGCLAPGCSELIRESPWVKAICAERIATNDRRKWLAGLGREDAAQFPSTQHGGRDTSPLLRRGDVPDVIHDKRLRDVVIREPSPTRPKGPRAGNRICKWVADDS